MNKSLIMGIIVGLLIGVVIGSLSFYAFSTSGILTTQYTLRLTVNNSGGSDQWIYIMDTYGAIAVLLQNNKTICDGAVHIDQWTNFTLPKGDYEMKVFDGEYGAFMYEREIYVMKNMNVTLTY